MAQSKKSPAKSAASKPAVPRKPDKAAQAKKAAAKPSGSKAAVAKTAKAKPVPAKAAPAAKPVAKANTKAQAKVAVATPPKTKAKAEVNAASKNKPGNDKRTQAKTAAAPKTAPAAKAAQTKPAPVKPASSAKTPVAPKAAAEAMLAARAKAAAAPAARAMPAAVHKPATRMMTAPSMPVLPAQPPMPRAAAANPKDVAAKAAEAKRQQMLAAPKKPVNSRHGFKIGESIVYPAHGVGQIVGIEEQEIAGMSLELFVIQIEKDKLTLRVPTARLEAAGIRKLAEDNIVSRAMETLKGRARIKRTMWSRRAQEYEAKINSGDLIAIAEVVRDLYRSETQPEQSYSERQLYESALDRMAREIAVVDKLDERTAMQRITEVLSRSARGRRTTEESAGDTQAA
ncbi:MAG TPA: CarD family transcriptional regulator [Hyphomicrobiaceae bacterium]|nr:CarD family transcriptional regulator [Hyphomicrobiaceae bacterium]